MRPFSQPCDSATPAPRNRMRPFSYTQMTTRVRRLPASIPTAYIGFPAAISLLLLILHRNAIVQPQIEDLRLRRPLDDVLDRKSTRLNQSLTHLVCRLLLEKKTKD